MLLTMEDTWKIVFHERGFQQPVPSWFQKGPTWRVYILPNLLTVSYKNYRRPVSLISWLRDFVGYFDNASCRSEKISLVARFKYHLCKLLSININLQVNVKHNLIVMRDFSMLCTWVYKSLYPWLAEMKIEDVCPRSRYHPFGRGVNILILLTKKL